MKTKRSWFLALSLAVALGAVASVPAHALPDRCEVVCDYSTSCDVECDWWNYTCGDYGVCDPGSSGCTNIYGTSWAETLNGGATNDCIFGFEGDDSLYGHAGNDELYGGDGEDSLYGGSGDDFHDGGADADYCDGGTGNNDAYNSCEG